MADGTDRETTYEPTLQSLLDKSYKWIFVGGKVSDMCWCFVGEAPRDSPLRLRLWLLRQSQPQRRITRPCLP